MATHFKDNGYKTAEVTSYNSTHHRCEIKDDYGNVLGVTHYQNMNKAQVEKDLKQQKFTQDNGLF